LQRPATSPFAISPNPPTALTETSVSLLRIAAKKCITACIDKKNPFSYRHHARQSSVFLFNRDLANAREAELLWEDTAPSRVLDSFTLTGNDLKAHNGFDAPQNFVPKPFDKPTTSNHRMRLELPARSYTVIQFAA
jgi:alpha-L-arabinofuranosidase